MGKYRIAEIIDIKRSNQDTTLTLEIDRDFLQLYSDEEIEVTLQSDSNFNIGDLLRFEEGNPTKLEKVPTENMDYTEFDALKRRILKMTCEQLITTHQSLKGKVDKSEIHDNLNYYEYYMNNVLDFDYGYSIAKSATPELHKFINSKYVSDYFKEMVKSKIIAKNSTIDADKVSTYFNEKEFNFIHDAIAFNAITSNREFKDFSEEEFDSIYKALQGIRKENGKRDYSYTQIIALAFNLDSQGALDFLNNKLDSIVVIKRILDTSGVSSSPEYYSGRGAKLCDLNGKNLISIYNKLNRLDTKKSLAMAKMTFEMPTLGATEFINSLYSLAYNNYDLEKYHLSSNNIDLGNGSENSRFVIGMASLASSMCYRSDDTIAIKHEFANLLPNEFKDKLNCDLQDNSYYHKSR